MQNPTHVRAFFERMSSAVATKAAPPVAMLHTVATASPDRQAVSFIPGDMRDAMLLSNVTSMQWEINDYGVGLPPLAGC
ncbi:MAG TPA: hypothetical protein V6C89_00365 [Drouetiella sp.]